tara:strand:- start:84 stop:488 length:405 start_codon:yes stop_codon:yes gene_type:complete
MKKIEKFNEFGITITSTMFITPDGEQYPIRNISAVRFGINNRTLFLLFSVIGLLFSSYLIYLSIGGYVNILTAGILFLISILTLAIWYFGRTFNIYISTAGVEKSAISFNQLEGDKEKFCKQVIKALTDSISEI